MKRITLYQDIPAERWFSMERYANALAEELARFPEIKLRRFSLPVPAPLFRGRAKLFFRLRAYPLLAFPFQGEVNHIADHSYARAIRHLSPEKTVITCHDLLPLSYEKDEQALAVFKKTIAFLPQAGRIIAVSQATKKDLLRRLKIPARKVTVIYEGVDDHFRRLSKNRRDLAGRFSLPSGKKFVFSVGNCLDYKNLPGLLRAFALVKREERDAVLLRLGGLTAKQKRLLVQLGLREGRDVFLFSNVSEEDLVRFYNLAQVTVIPSFQEGFGFPVLESMRCGTPVVCSATSSLPEVGGKCAFYCQPGDEKSIAKQTLRVLRLGKQQYSGVGERGIAWAERFTWRRCALETVQIYQSVLG